MPLPILRFAALIVGSGSGMCWLVLLVTILLVLCFVLGQGDMPVVFLSGGFGQTVQKTADSPQLQSIAGRRHFLPFAEQILLVQAFQQTTEVSQLLYASGGRCPRCAVTMRLGCVPLGYAGQVFLVVMDQKDSCSGVYKAGIDGYNALRAVFSSLVRRHMMLGIMAFMDQKDSGSVIYYAGFAGDNAPRAVFLGLQAHDARHHGRYGPEGQIWRREQGLRSRSPWCGARFHCRVWIWCRWQGLRSRSPGFGARVHCRMLQLINKVVYTLSWRRGSTVACIRRLCMVPRLQAWRRQSSPHVEKTVKIHSCSSLKLV